MRLQLRVFLFFTHKKRNYLINSASPLIIKLKLLYLLSPICRLKGKDYLMYRRLMFIFAVYRYCMSVCYATKLHLHLHFYINKLSALTKRYKTSKMPIFDKDSKRLANSGFLFLFFCLVNFLAA